MEWMSREECERGRTVDAVDTVDVINDADTALLISARAQDTIAPGGEVRVIHL